MYTLGEIIAMKGLPFTGKFEIAKCLSEWSNFPVLYIDDFLDAVSFDRGITINSPPSKDEAERLQRLAFDALYHVANELLAFFTNRLVLKSRLCSTYEIERLLELAAKYKRKLIIVECIMENERQWEHRLVHKVSDRASRHGNHDCQWFKSRSWKDVENARDEYDARAWDLHFRRLINGLSYDDDDYDNNNSEGEGEGEGEGDGDGDTYNGTDIDGDLENIISRVKRVILNVVDDLDLIPYSLYGIKLTNEFQDVIQYLISEDEEKGDTYATMQFTEVRRFLLERKLVVQPIKKGAKNFVQLLMPIVCSNTHKQQSNPTKMIAIAEFAKRK